MIAAVVLGAAGTFGNSIGQSIFNDVTGPKGPPVIIESAQYQEVFGLGNNFAFPQQLSPAQAASFDSGQEDYPSYMDRIAAEGGAQVSAAAVEMVLRGNAKQTVVISNIQIDSHCTAPPSGTLLYSPSAGSPPNIKIGFNLDAQSPIAQNANITQLYGSYFTDHTISLQPGETQTLVIYALTRLRYCTFSYRLVIDTSNGQIIEPVTNMGKPFEVAGLLLVPHDSGPGIFARYRALYVGGVAPGSSANGGFVSANPKTFLG